MTHGATGMALRRVNVRVAFALLVALPSGHSFTCHLHHNTKGRAMTVIYLGEPTGPRLRSLSRSQEEALDRWLTNALRNPPSKRDPLPVGYTRALSALAKRRGITLRFNGDRLRVRGEVILGKNLPGCVGGSKRRVVVTDSREAVSRAGNRVEPWNMREWRE